MILAILALNKKRTALVDKGGSFVRLLNLAARMKSGNFFT